MALNWVRSADISQVPTGAVLAGCDSDGSDVFVGRVWQSETTWTLVTIIPIKGIAHGLRNDGTTFESTEAEFLFAPEFYWSDDCGEIPFHALAYDDNKYIGRFINDDDTAIVGEIRAEEGYIYCYGLPPQEEYLALCTMSKESIEADLGTDNWESVRLGGPVPADAVQAGQDDEGHPLFVARSWQQNDLLPGGIVGTTSKPAHVDKITVPWGCFEILAEHGMVLTGAGYSWQACEDGNVPERAVRAGVTVTGEPLYAGRANFMGHTIPGKIHPSQHRLYIGWAGKEYKFRKYEVLVLTAKSHYPPM